MNIKRVTYCALAAFAFAASCSKEAAEPGVYDWTGRDICIKATLPEIGSTRGHSMTLDDLSSFQVTCFNTVDYNGTATDPLPPYFEDSAFIREGIFGKEMSFISQMSEEWPDSSKLIKFYAFSPSRDEMKKNNLEINNTNINDFFKLSHNALNNATGVSIDYRLDKVRVNPDIMKQFDFITSEVSGNRHEDFSGGVELAFHHQMSQVEIRAWGGSTFYDIEIAGVRLGNPIIENSYIFSDASTSESSGRWSAAGEAVKGKVDYVYRNENTTGGGAGTGDKIYFIRRGEHNTEGSAASIMGIGGYAMVIPGRNEKWEGLSDPDIRVSPYKTEKMYISVLMRITDQQTGVQRYPYPGNRNGMEVITYAVDKDGKIIYRLYPGTKVGEYYTDQWNSNRYTAGYGEEIHEFGWAAVPVDIAWEAGKRYVYTLNYSEGVGIHDPSDPEPGRPIQGLAPVEWGMSVGNWDYAVKNDDYDPDIDVP